MTAKAVRIAQCALRDAVRCLTTMKKVHHRFGQGRVLVKIVEVAGQIAQIFKCPAQTAGCSAYAHIVPHGVADRRPVLGDQRRVVMH